MFDTDLGGVSTYEAFDEHLDTIVMGRVTYEETLKLLDGKPFYDGKETIVFSRSKHPDFPRGRFTSEDPVELLSKMKQEEGGWIWIVGGGGLFAELLEADLIDEYWIQITPVLLGEGKRLFVEGDYAQRLEFVETTQMGEMTELHYRKKVMEKE